MEISIDEAIEQVTECKAYKQCDTEKDSEAFDILVNIARKYQKIEKLIDSWELGLIDNIGYEISEVIEDGNDSR